MRHAAMVLALGALCGPAVLGQEAPPKELQSPNPGTGGAADYLNNIRAKWLERPEGRHAALLFLQELPETDAYLGRPLASALKPDLVRLLSDDLRTAAWADIV